MNTHTSNRSAFSLVELLVVLAIIGLLMGVTSAYIMGAKSRARGVECQKNLGDWTKGLSMLIDESRIHAFPAAGKTGAREDATAWYNAIARPLDLKPLCDYGEGDRIPSPRGGIKSVYVCPEAGSRGGDGLFSYSYNKHLSKGDKTLRASQVKRPSELVVLMDSPRTSLWAADQEDVLSDRAECFRHGGQMNIAFYDGHVGAFKRAKVQQGADTPTAVNESSILWDPWEESGPGSN